MAILETNYDELDSKTIEIPDSLVEVLEALSNYCDKHSVSYPNSCFDCPFYIHEIECSCFVAKSGFNSPCNWAVYKDDKGGDNN